MDKLLKYIPTLEIALIISESCISFVNIDEHSAQFDECIRTIINVNYVLTYSHFKHFIEKCNLLEKQANFKYTYINKSRLLLHIEEECSK